MLALTVIAVVVNSHASVAEEPSSTTTERATVLGIVTERPAEGRFVETDRGFMVPYTATIPGTDVKFTMMPIPGGKHEVTRDGVTYFVQIEPFWMAKTEVTWGRSRNRNSRDTPHRTERQRRKGPRRSRIARSD
jgi:hypothetical protein